MTHSNPGQFDDIPRGPFRKGNIEHEAALAKLADNARHLQFKMSFIADRMRNEGHHGTADKLEEMSGLKGITDALSLRHAEFVRGGTVSANAAPKGQIDFTGSDLAKVDRASDIHKQYGGDGHIDAWHKLFGPERSAKDE